MKRLENRNPFDFTCFLQDSVLTMVGLNGDGRIGFGNKPFWMLCEVDERIGRKGNGIAMAKTKSGSQTPAERKIVEADVKQLIEKLASSHSKLIASIRRRLRERLPTAFELVYGIAIGSSSVFLRVRVDMKVFWRSMQVKKG